MKSENKFKKFFSYNQDDELEGNWKINEGFKFGKIDIEARQIFFQTKVFSQFLVFFFFFLHFKNFFLLLNKINPKIIILINSKKKKKKKKK